MELIVNNDYDKILTPEFMDVESMIKHTKKYDQSFINYFEAIMNPEGKVALAVPSHEQRILHFYLENGGDLNEIPIDVAPMLWIAQKYGLYIIYFNRLKVPMPTYEMDMDKIDIPVHIGEAFQRLTKEKIIDVHTIEPNWEYSNYLKRLELQKG